MVAAWVEAGDSECAWAPAEPTLTDVWVWVPDDVMVAVAGCL